MISNLDIYRSANEIIKRHGVDAGIHAAMKADKFMAVGDLDGAAVWRRIGRAIGELIERVVPPNAPRH